MTNFTKSCLLICTVIAAVCSNGCDKTIEQDVLPGYAPAKIDSKGGQWVLYLPDTLTPSVAVPAEVSSTAYQNEITELKGILSSRTADQTDMANYWNTGAVYRWHEIARNLAAKYNLPPVARPDGTYPVPDAANPFAEPKFPFANPPYASRVFAYLGVAQYEALVKCWAVKFQHNRLAPSKNDASISSLKPVSDIPSYPSEDAVVAAASFEVLKAMFPCEVEYLTKMRGEAINSRLWAGTNVRSDLDAGDALGTAMGKKVMGRAKTDGMGGANKPNADGSLQTIIQAAQALDPTMPPWVSLDLPARPPLLPAFGKVKTWNMNATDLVTVRPAQPPAIGSEAFKTDLEELRKIAKKQDREQMRIASFWGDGPGTYTPPGHWNRSAADLAYRAQFNELRFARVMALEGTAVQDAGISCWETKYYYYYPRPFQMDNDVKSTLGTPNFPSYTSGHSTFSAAGAEILSYLFPNDAASLKSMAKEASESRIYGCIHYRFDCEQGLVAGSKVGDFAINRARNDGSDAE